AEPLDIVKLFAPNPKAVAAQRLVEAGAVSLGGVTPPERRDDNRRETRANAPVTGGQGYDGLGSVGKTRRLRLGRCECPYFQTILLSRGPCEHLLAVTLALEAAQDKTAGALEPVAQPE